MKRKRWVIVAAILLLVSVSLFAGGGADRRGGDFPTRPITAIAPFGAGGGTDRSVRVMSMAWERYSSVPMRVVNMPGGNSNIGMRFLKEAAPDGYTILQNGSQMLSNPYFGTYDEVGWTLEEFEPIGIQQLINFILVVPVDSPFQTLNDLVAFGRANPGAIRHASVGYGGDSHIAFMALEQAAGFTATVVPFDSGADQVANIAGGHVDAAIATSGTMLPLARSGRARILAAGTPERVAAFGDVPTAREQGIDWTFVNWRGWLAPPGTPRNVIDYLADVMSKVVSDPEISGMILNEGEIPEFFGPAEFRDYLAWVRTVYEPAIRAIQEGERR